jgi:hypothetical protein
MEWQQYESYKVVRAFKITDAERTGDHNVRLWNRETGAETVVEEEWMMKHSPGSGDTVMTSLLGGYVVRYSDGYQSWSPAKAFEEGYRTI